MEHAVHVLQVAGLRAPNPMGQALCLPANALNASAGQGRALLTNLELLLQARPVCLRGLLQQLVRVLKQGCHAGATRQPGAWWRAACKRPPAQASTQVDRLAEE